MTAILLGKRGDVRRVLIAHFTPVVERAVEVPPTGPFKIEDSFRTFLFGSSYGYRRVRYDAAVPLEDDTVVYVEHGLPMQSTARRYLRRTQASLFA